MKKLCWILFTLLVLSMGGSAQSKMALDFTLADMDGSNYKLSENYGKGPILINFWATWCIPCLEEMKKFKKIYKKYKDKGLMVLSISIDDPKTVGRVKGFVKTRRYPFKILLDTNSEVFKLYQGTNPPLTLLLDKNGRIVYNHTGYRKGDEKKVDQQIGKLIENEQALQRIKQTKQK